MRTTGGANVSIKMCYYPFFPKCLKAVQNFTYITFMVFTVIYALTCFNLNYPSVSAVIV